MRRALKISSVVLETFTRVLPKLRSHCCTPGATSLHSPAPPLVHLTLASCPRCRCAPSFPQCIVIILPVSNIHQRGIRRLRSSNPLPRKNTPPLSMASVWVTMFLKFTGLDTSQYMRLPSVNSPGGGSLFGPSLDPLPRFTSAALCGTCGGVWAYVIVDSPYHPPAACVAVATPLSHTLDGYQNSGAFAGTSLSGASLSYSEHVLVE